MAKKKSCTNLRRRGVLDCFCSLLVGVAPRLFITALKRDHLDLLVRCISDRRLFHWADSQVPDQIEGFEDLTFLFWSTPANRGLVRMDFDEAALLFRSIKNLRPSFGVEIGRLRGGSTTLLAAAMPMGSVLLSVEKNPRFDEDIAAALDRMKLSDRVVLAVADSSAVDARGQPDFVFVDGDHSYGGVRSDYLKWLPFIRIGGLLVFHDMGNTRRHATQLPGPARLKAEIEAVEASTRSLSIVGEAGSLIIFEVTNASRP